MDSFCQRQGLDLKTVRFVYEGERVMEDATAQSLGMDDGDTIDAMVEQTGGF